jgi:hypothetical protein
MPAVDPPLFSQKCDCAMQFAGLIKEAAVFTGLSDGFCLVSRFVTL